MRSHEIINYLLDALENFINLQVRGNLEKFINNALKLRT